MYNFTSLSQFYTSSEWRKFRQVVIAERINKIDGVLYDEYSGKPIVRAHDIILHHIQPLTLQNVNDRGISLNPDNIMIVTPQSHNEIHKRFSGQLSTWQRKVYLVHGAPCSGKTTYVKENMQKGDLVLDIDMLWQAMSLQDNHIKPNELKPVVFATYNCIVDQIKTRAGKWGVAWVISAEAYPAQRQRIIDMLGAEEIQLDTDRLTCLERLHSKPEGRDIELYKDLINKYYDNLSA